MELNLSLFSFLALLSVYIYNVFHYIFFHTLFSETLPTF